MAEPLLALDDVSVAYGRIRAVRESRLRVDAGEVVCLLGSNGAGKSSTLNAIVGLVPIAAGRLRFDGADLTGAAAERRVRAGIALAPEGRRVFAGLTVEENLRLAGWRLRRAGYAAQVERLVELFPVLERKLHAKSGSLSGGEQQQLALGRALLAEPKLLLLDEPSLGLDPINTGRIFDALHALKRDGPTILLAEQNVTRALALADRAYVLDSGATALEGVASELSAEAIERAYLGITAGAA